MLRFGAVVAGLNCQHVGCVPPTRGEVEAALAQG
jgi:fructokinase